MKFSSRMLVEFGIDKAKLTDFASLLQSSCRLFLREIGQFLRHIFGQISQCLVRNRNSGSGRDFFCHYFGDGSISHGRQQFSLVGQKGEG